MITANTISSASLKQHWFWPAALTVCIVNATVIMLDGWQSTQIKEFGVLFDFAVLIPCLYLICYWAKGKKAFVRAIALACLGIWVASHIVPDDYHVLIGKVSFLRYAGLFVLIAIEIRLGIEIYRLAFRSQRGTVGQTVRQKAEEKGLPPWVAKLMAAEARFWRNASDFIRGLFRR